MNKKIIVPLVALILLVGLCGAGYFGWQANKTQAAANDAKQLQDKIFDEKTSDEDRSKMFEEMRSKRDEMSESQRQAFGEQMREGFMKRMDERLTRFFDASEEDRIAMLDEDIQRQEDWRKQREQRRAENPDGDRRGEGREGGGRNGGGPGGADRGGPRGPGGPGARGGTDEDRSKRRDDRRRSISDRTTPEQRAKFKAYREAMNERREQLGLPPARMGRPHRRGA